MCVSFQNDVYPISHVRKLLNVSNLHGWSVLFVGDTFTNATIISNSEDMWNDAFFTVWWIMLSSVPK
jgi:hypothetical protein